MAYVFIFTNIFPNACKYEMKRVTFAQRKSTFRRKYDSKTTSGEEGKSVSCMAKRWKDSFPGIPFAADSELTAEQLSAISKERKSGSVKNTETEMSGKSIMKLYQTRRVTKGYSSGKLKMDWVKFRAGAIDVRAASLLVTPC